MFELTPITHRKKMSPSGFVVSAILHASMTFLIFNLAVSGQKRQAHLSMTPLYAPEPTERSSTAPPVRIHPAPTHLPPLRVSNALAFPARPAAISEPSVQAALPSPGPTPVRTPDPAGAAGFRVAPHAETVAPHAQTTPASFGSPTAAIPARRSDAAPIQIGRLEGPRAMDAPLDRAPVASAGFSQPIPGDPRRTVSRSPTSASGFGDRTVSPAGAATSTLAQATTTHAFGSVGAANSKPPGQPPTAKSQFETIRAQTIGPANRPAESGDRQAALEILDKPRPDYSAEARVLQIEGEVVLEVLFTASGQIRVLRVLRGLGHGLDENATRAAMAIRFRPAVEQGKPLDTVATVRIDFQLAH